MRPIVLRRPRGDRRKRRASLAPPGWGSSPLRLLAGRREMLGWRRHATASSSTGAARRSARPCRPYASTNAHACPSLSWTDYVAQRHSPRIHRFRGLIVDRWGCSLRPCEATSGSLHDPRRDQPRASVQYLRTPHRPVYATRPIPLIASGTVRGKERIPRFSLSRVCSSGGVNTVDPRGPRAK